MNIEEIGQGINLFNMNYLSSVTAMILAVNLITQVIKEIFFVENTIKKIPKLIALGASLLIVSVHHYSTWTQNPGAFHQSIVELIFLIFLNSILIAGLSMGNYKVLNLTKDRKYREAQEQFNLQAKVQPQNMEPIEEEKGELH